MGITQHRHGTANVHMLANLLLARGQIGRPVQGFVRFVGTVTCKATALWALMNSLARNFSIILTVCSVLNHQEKWIWCG